MAKAGLLPSEACGTRSTMGSCWWEAPPVATCRRADGESNELQRTGWGTTETCRSSRDTAAGWHRVVASQRRPEPAS